ncbi:MAG: hypothetical protein HYZ47_01195, partial [Simkania negevensis]|nr:hypothetical protein [Simkania negevensis]
KKERTIIVPLTGTPSWIEESQSSQNYLENMGTFLSDLLLSRSPADVTWRNEHLLKHVHPAFYHQISSKLKEEEAFLTQQDQSFVFRPERSFANPSQMTFTIEGESLIIITRAGADPTCAQREKKRYVLIFMCENQKLLLTALNQETILP